jgi:tetratricopeptide (TPR) repeat protein
VIRRILSVSVPRSGHHFLTTLIRRLLGDDCHYCEFYTPVDCCRSIPCSRSGAARLGIQKNHDFDLQLPARLPDVTYVIQYRQPVMAVLSDREYLARMEGRDRADDLDEYVVWLAKKAAYFQEFWTKWLHRPADGHIVVEYSELLRDPVAIVQRVLAAVDIKTDDAAIAAILPEVAEFVADFPLAPGLRFAPRVMAQSRYFDEELISLFESLILETIPSLEETRLLPRAPVTEHPTRLIYQSILLRNSGALAESIDHLKLAVRSAPENAHVLKELSLACLETDRGEEALVFARRALELRPGNTELLRLLSDLHSLRAQTELDRAVELARQLVAATGGQPGHLVHLAALLLRRKDYGEAAELAVHAMSLGSEDGHVWRECSEVLSIAGDVGGARSAVEEALLRQPSNAEFHHHLGNLHVRAGDRAAALRSHARAVELAPDQIGWRCVLARELVASGAVSEALATLDRGLARQPDDARLTQLRARLSAEVGAK